MTISLVEELSVIPSMKPYKDLTGYNNGYVTVLEFVSFDKGGKGMWRIMCHCGNQWVARGGNVKSGVIKSCGCKRAESVRKKLFKGVGEMSGAFWSRITFNAKSRGHQVNVKKQDVYKLFEDQEGKCALSGEAISFKDKTASLDRIDSSKHYERGNLQWIHKDLNRMKNTFSQQDFLNWINKIHTFRSTCIAQKSK